MTGVLYCEIQTIYLFVLPRPLVVEPGTKQQETQLCTAGCPPTNSVKCVTPSQMVQNGAPYSK